MSLDDDIRILARVELFEEFSQDHLRLLAFGAETLRIAAGRELYQEGRPADCAYVVVSGEVALTHPLNGKQVAVGSAGPGSMLGELGLISGASRLTGAVARTDTEVIRISRTLFRRILEEHPDLAARLHHQISERLSGLIARLEKLAPRF